MNAIVIASSPLHVRQNRLGPRVARLSTVRGRKEAIMVDGNGMAEEVGTMARVAGREGQTDFRWLLDRSPAESRYL